MRYIVISSVLAMCWIFIGDMLWGQDIVNEVNPPASFNIIEPADGSFFRHTSPEDSINFAWEDVLGLGNESGNNANTAMDISIPLGVRLLFDDDENLFDKFLPEEYYSILIGFDPGLFFSFSLPWLEPGFIAKGLHLGVLQYAIQLLFEEPVDSVDLFWTIGATNEAGTTWANDTFYVSYEIDNNPPLSEFDLVAPAHGTTMDIKIEEDSGMPLPEDLTFTWESTTDPDGDDIFYWWVASNVYPIPPLLDLLERIEDESVFFKNSVFRSPTNNSDSRILKKQSEHDVDTVLVILPSGDLTFMREFLDEYVDDIFNNDSEVGPQDLDLIFDALVWMLSGGRETSITLPNEVFYLLMVEELETEAATMYWTTIASDGFSFLHWAQSRDTSAVTMEISPVTTVKHIAGIPSEYYLNQNYPNPFNPATTIEYGIKFDGRIEISVYTMLGQKVMDVVNEYQKAGSYTVTFDASRLSSGTYFYTLRAGNEFIEKRRMMLIK